MNATAALTLARVATGAVLLAAPGTVLRSAARGRSDRPARIVTRVLGARHLVQAALTGLRPAPAALGIGAGVDALHAATALGLAAVDPSRRRDALANAVTALAFAGAGAQLARRGGRR